MRSQHGHGRAAPLFQGFVERGKRAHTGAGDCERSQECVPGTSGQAYQRNEQGGSSGHCPEWHNRPAADARCGPRPAPPARGCATGTQTPAWSGAASTQQSSVALHFSSRVVVPWAGRGQACGHRAFHLWAQVCYEECVPQQGTCRASRWCRIIGWRQVRARPRLEHSALLPLLLAVPRAPTVCLSSPATAAKYEPPGENASATTPREGPALLLPSLGWWSPARGCGVYKS